MYVQTNTQTHRPTEGQYTKLESEPMPQITKDNVSLYNSFVDGSDLIVRQSDHSLHSSRGAQQSDHSLHSPEQNGKMGGSTELTAGSDVLEESSADRKAPQVEQTCDATRDSQQTSISDSLHGAPPPLDLGIIQNSLTHSGITEQQAVPFNRNRPASERHRKRAPAGATARLGRAVPAVKQPETGATDKSCTRNRPKSDRYVKHKRGGAANLDRSAAT